MHSCSTPFERGTAPWAIGLLVILVLIPGQELLAQPGSLFADPTARRTGDALTVVILENASATNRSSTSSDKSNQLGINSDRAENGNLLSFIPLHSMQSGVSNQYTGQATTTRSANVNARVTVQVVDTKPNGDLIVEGVRTLKINGETEAIYLSGSVNPSFVSRDNTVLSSSIADLHIEYTGRGTVTHGTRPGLLVRFINWIF